MDDKDAYYSFYQSLWNFNSQENVVIKEDDWSLPIPPNDDWIATIFQTRYYEDEAADQDLGDLVTCFTYFGEDTGYLRQHVLVL